MGWDEAVVVGSCVEIESVVTNLEQQVGSKLVTGTVGFASRKTVGVFRFFKGVLSV